MSDIKMQAEGVIKKILVLGSGGLRIGQAGEFDYSGSQAIKALKEEGAEIVLINPNIATRQTDADMADVLYLQPLNVLTVIEIIKKEKPDAVMLGFGGQTALNIGMELDTLGIFTEYQVEILGTSINSIRLAEDRDLFRCELNKIKVKTPRSIAASSIDAAVVAAQELGYPIMMRSAYSLGGLGSGRVTNSVHLRERMQETLSLVPQVLIEEYLTGWIEIEYEIIRDCDGNSLTICNMENLDPMGIHTGESIVVSPSLTLNNNEYHELRRIALIVAEHFKIIGECNIQYAFDPSNGDYRVIEINPRLSRSSALASKATGYPLAFVAAKLSLGLRLHEITNRITQKTSAFFEPALDYVVVKIPRWDTQKFRTVDRRIGTEMKSVGEVMAIGRNFAEALQKAVGMLNIGANDIADYSEVIDSPIDEITNATDRRLFAIYQAYKMGKTSETIHTLSGIHRFFLQYIEAIYQTEEALTNKGLSYDRLLRAKQLGFSDRSIANFTGYSPEAIRSQRIKQSIIPYVKQIDTLAGEFDATTNYLYLTYGATQHDIAPLAQRPVIVLGSGPYSIGSSIEFDWCCVTTAQTLNKLGESSIIINSNPETVSTDYDESDRLYFEQLSLERVLDIAEFENPKGFIVSVGGQIANNLAQPLVDAGFNLLGTSAKIINKAENRKLFSALLSELNIDQPCWATVETLEQAKVFSRDVGYPVLIRPSYVLSGTAMAVVYSDSELVKYCNEALRISPDHPTVISKFIKDAKELEMDAVAKNGEIVIQAISEHVENAGVHSGDATIVLPPQQLGLRTISRIQQVSKEVVKALSVTGPLNLQFIIKHNSVKVIECNLRASRTFPFVSKVTNQNFIEIATEVMCDKYTPKRYETLALNYVGVKSPVFSYGRLKGSNPVAHVEMASTGEVACLGLSYHQAYFTSWQASGSSIKGRTMLVSITDNEKYKFLSKLCELESLGWIIYATGGTHDYLMENNVDSHCVFKANEKIYPDPKTLIINERCISLVINIPSGGPLQSVNLHSEGFLLRRLAIDHGVPLITNAEVAMLLCDCLIEQQKNSKPLSILSWQEFVTKSRVTEREPITAAEAVN